MQYQGHHSDGSGIQNHSAGPLYPYVIGVRERQVDGEFVRSWILLGGKIRGEIELRTHDDAVEAAQLFLAQDEIRAAAPKGVELASLQINNAFDRVHAHNQREWSRFAAQRSSIQ